MRLRLRFLCPDCGKLRRVLGRSEVMPAHIRLACGHERTFALLPSHGISLEDLKTEDGLRLFPFQPDEASQ